MVPFLLNRVYISLCCAGCSWRVYIYVQAVVASEHDNSRWLACHNGHIKDIRGILRGQIISFLVSYCICTRIVYGLALTFQYLSLNQCSSYYLSVFAHIFRRNKFSSKSTP